MCAWSYAYNASISNKISENASYDITYFNNDVFMNQHLKSRMKLKHQKIYEIEWLEINDWGSYDLIVHHFLKEKDPEVWKY